MPALSTWWKSIDDLNDEQKGAFALNPHGSYVVFGPAGSGKTNLLLLRTEYLVKSGMANVVVLTFTSMLKQFLLAGGSTVAGFNPNRVKTIMAWQDDVLRKNGVQVDRNLGFAAKRLRLADELKQLYDAKPLLEKTIDCILVDEVQDCTAEEIALFRRAAKHVFFVGDARQQVYQERGLLEDLKKQVTPVELTLHYRNGQKICEAADEVAEQMGEKRTAGACNYIERLAPSSVSFFACKDADEQFDVMCARLKKELAAYPDELLGVIVPLRDDVADLVARFEASELADSIAKEEEPFDPFRPDARIIVTTVHSAKGLEFRTVHVPNAQTIGRHTSREMHVSYTAITRAKTTLSILSTGPLPMHLEPVRNLFAPPPAQVDLSALFTGSGR